MPPINQSDYFPPFRCLSVSSLSAACEHNTAMAKGEPASLQFVEEELDGLCLRNEDQEHITYCDACLSDLENIKPGLVFKLFHYRSAENSSSDDDVSPEREPFNKLVPCTLIPTTSELTTTLSTIPQIMTRRICDWNTVEHASQVYSALKVNAYIVRPNYFLSACLHTSTISQLNMDSLFENPEGDCDWSLYEPEFDRFLKAFAFVGCQDLCHSVFQYWKHLNTLQFNIRKCKDDHARYVRLRVQSILEGVEAGKVTEYMSLEYVMALFNFFDIKTISAGFNLCVRNQAHFQLSFPKVEPKREVVVDLHVDCRASPFLVGEFKKFKEEKPAKDLQRSGDLNELSQEVEKKLKIRCCRHAEENGGGDHNKKSEEGCGYRKISTVELHKVSRYLPQLLGGMLACVDANGGHRAIANLMNSANRERNHTVQLGFTVEGFKLRFVRLVLSRNCKKKGTKAPITIDDLLTPDVKSQVFLTKEINLFHKRHLKLFFKYLFAIASISPIDPAD